MPPEDWRQVALARLAEWLTALVGILKQAKTTHEAGTSVGPIEDLPERRRPTIARPRQVSIRTGPLPP